MSAREQISMLLNELMGPSRNNDVDRSALNYKDAEICKFFLVSFCPHELFVNTKADIGPCQYYHDENLRIAYRNSRDFEKLGYERSFYRFLCKMHDDMMRKIQKNKERLALTQGSLTNVDEETKTRLTEKIQKLDKEIAGYLQEAEDAGAKGDLERSQKYVKKSEELKAEVETVKKSLAPIPPPVVKSNDPNAPKPMEVCETCGCFLIIGDVQQRIEEHFTGKQHLGFAKITSTLAELKDRIRAIDNAEKSPERRRRSLSRPRDRNREDHHKDRDSRKKPSRSDDRHRSSKKSRSRSRSRNRHSRHQQHHRRSRSNSRRHH